MIPILFVHSGQDWIRGSERCLLDLLAHLDRARCAPAVLCDAPALAREAAALGSRTFPLVDWQDRPRARAALRAALRAHGARLLHLNDAMPMWTVLPVARTRSVPIVCHVHLPNTAVDRRWGLLHLASAIVGVSHAVVEGFLVDGTDPGRVHVVHNGVDPARVERGDARGLRAALGIPAPAFVIGSVGSLIPRKGHDVTITALAALRARAVDAHLVIAGEGPERAALAAQAAAAGIGAAVHLLGERDDAGAILRDAVDVVVTAARAEAFPLNVLEAQLVGRMVVASDIPPHREALVPGETGWLVPGESPGALAESLAAVAHDPELAARMGAAGAARVRAGFLVDRYVAEMSARYDALLAEPAWRHGWLGVVPLPPVYRTWARDAVVRRLRRLVRGAPSTPVATSSGP